MNAYLYVYLVALQLNGLWLRIKSRRVAAVWTGPHGYGLAWLLVAPPLRMTHIEGGFKKFNRTSSRETLTQVRARGRERAGMVIEHRPRSFLKNGSVRRPGALLGRVVSHW